MTHLLLETQNPLKVTRHKGTTGGITNPGGIPFSEVRIREEVLWVLRSKFKEYTELCVRRCPNRVNFSEVFYTCEDPYHFYRQARDK